MLENKRKIPIFFSRWFIQCNEGYQLNIEFTDFNVEPELDRVVLMSVNSGGSKKVVAEVKSTGSYRTDSNQLLLRFTTDCDVSNLGFRAVISAEENEIPQIPTTSPLDTTTSSLETTTSSLETTDNVYVTTPSPSEITTLPMETTETTTVNTNCESICSLDILNVFIIVS